MAMDMNRFHDRYEDVAANTRTQFGDIPKLVVSNGISIRLVGDFSSTFEHFVETPKGPRPYTCDGPESDCPLCEAASKLSYDDNNQLQELGKAIKAKEKFYFNCLDRTPTGKTWHASNRKTKILTQNDKGLSIGTQLFKCIGDVVKMRRQQGQVDDPNTFDIMLMKSGSGMTTKYGAQFTGQMDALTEDELAYERWPLNELTKVSPRIERETAANAILSSGGIPQNAAGSDDPPFDSPNIAANTAKGPVQVARQQATTIAMKPAQVPNRAASQQQPTTPTAAPAPARLPQSQPAKLVIKQNNDQYQNTAVTSDADPSTSMIVPCPDCAVDMQINMADMRDLKCHGCGKVFTHPTKG